MSRAHSRVERSKEEKKQRKVKVVMKKGTINLIKYSWFPVTALILFSMGLYVGVYLMTKDSSAFFSGDLWASFINALRNF